MKTKSDDGASHTQVIFVGNGRCYHTFDWYRNAQRLLAPQKVPFATDLVDSEGHSPLLLPDDPRIDLINIDAVMFQRQSAGGNVWRNLVKALLVPMQAAKLRGIAREYSSNGAVIFHAHSMYYLFLCALARVRYIGTPQGSEVLVRPHRSRIYRAMAKLALKSAGQITVDSVSMQRGVREIAGRDAIVLQNGINVQGIMERSASREPRTTVLSSRGFYPLYRIDRIIDGRDRAAPGCPLTFSYPSWEDNYRKQCQESLRPGDRDLGRLPTREQMYDLLKKTLLVISIPESDSSPRSVYEAIFCGCCVATIYNSWIEDIPDCMKSRLHIVRLENENWFAKAFERAHEIVQTPYHPSEAALDLFDQKRSLDRLARLCYSDAPRSSPRKLPA